MYVCTGKVGVRACEHMNVLRDRTCFQPKTSSVCKVQIENKEDLPLGAQAASTFVLSLSLLDTHEPTWRNLHSCTRVQGNA